MITRAEINGVVFNDTTDNRNFMINEVTGLEMPPVRLVNYNLAGEHFGLFVSAFYGKRSFTLRGWVIGDTQTDFISKRDEIQNALGILAGEQSVLITLANARALQIDAICTGLDFMPQPGDVNAAKFSASFQASFPFLVSQVETATPIYLPTGGGGSVPPAEMPAGIAADSGGTLTAVNAGNGVYYPSARIYGPVTNPALRNDAISKELDLTITLAAGEYIDVDFKRKTIVDQSGVNRYAIKSGDWWYIQPGSNLIKYLAGTYNATTYTLFYYRDSYLGI